MASLHLLSSGAGDCLCFHGHVSLSDADLLPPSYNDLVRPLGPQNPGSPPCPGPSLQVCKEPFAWESPIPRFWDQDEDICEGPLFSPTEGTAHHRPVGTVECGHTLGEKGSSPSQMSYLHVTAPEGWFGVR